MDFQVAKLGTGEGGTRCGCSGGEALFAEGVGGWVWRSGEMRPGVPVFPSCWRFHAGSPSPLPCFLGWVSKSGSQGHETKKRGLVKAGVDKGRSLGLGVCVHETTLRRSISSKPASAVPPQPQL